MRREDPVVPADVPGDVEALARARSEARARRDWPTADRLRAEIESAGWRVVDRGIDSTLVPAHPANAIDRGRVRYGSSASVPSRLSEPATGLATIVLAATDWPDDLARAMGGLRAHAPAGTSVVVVANDPSAAQAAALRGDVGDRALGLIAPIAGTEPEVVWTSARLGWAAALNAGLRRASAPVVILLDTSVEPAGDLVTPMVAALEDRSVAMVGAFGVDSRDLRRFEAAPAGDVDAIEGYAMAFRRADYVARGPLDEHFRYYRNLDLWWSLVLRDEGEGRSPRRAVASDLPLTRHEHRGWESLDDAERARLSKRNFYRIIDRFGKRYDLLKAAAPRTKR